MEAGSFRTNEFPYIVYEESIAKEILEIHLSNSIVSANTCLAIYKILVLD